MKKNKKLLLDIEDKPKLGQGIILALQHVFAMFGATILVPILVNNIAGKEVLTIPVALASSGIGTLLYQLCTKGKSPVYLGSSFAYITPMAVSFAAAGTGGVFTGIVTVGLIYILFAIIIKFVGVNWLHRMLPPVVIGPMIMVIGLSLAPTAISEIGITGDAAISIESIVIALVTFISTIILAIYAKGFLKVIPFLGGMTIGYITAVILGVVDFTPVKEAAFFSVPHFNFIFVDYAINFKALLMIAPIALVTIAEHIGDHTVLSEIVDRDLLKDPGLDKTLLGDGVATLTAGLIGGPPNTTYGENTAVVGMTKVASTKVLSMAAIFAIAFSFLGKLTAIFSTIPNQVLGGVAILLYGFISVNGLIVLVKNQVDFNKTKNVVVAATMLVLGLGGAAINITSGSFNLSITGMTLAAIVGIILNLVLREE